MTGLQRNSFSEAVFAFQKIQFMLSFFLPDGELTDLFTNAMYVYSNMSRKTIYEYRYSLLFFVGDVAAFYSFGQRADDLQVEKGRCRC